MLDRLSPEERSAHMRRIRKVDTAPEVQIRRAAHALGFRFRLHRRDLPGTPDLVFPKYKKVIQVNGCFWHQHPGCKLARLPKSRLDYWLPKLRRNQARDSKNLAALQALGWEVLVVWECEIGDTDAALQLISSFLPGSISRASTHSAASMKGSG